MKEGTCYRFSDFALDAADRRLTRDGAVVDVNGRYLDALLLMIREAGRLVSKDRFMSEVWRGIPVTDEALTQCIRTLRKALGDDAARPRMIETVPKHGYRFVADVTIGEGAGPSRPASGSPLRNFAALAAAGTIGGGLAGLTGGLFYGFAAARLTGAGSLSMLLVIMCLCILVSLIGAAGVSLALAGAMRFGRSAASGLALAGAAGGGVVGAVAQLLGLDAFSLLVGRAPAGITGGPEGALIGAAVGFGLSFAIRQARPRLRRGAILGGLCGALAGAAIPMLGGRMMLGSLDLLAQTFPASQLRVGEIGRLAGETGLGPISQTVSAALEGGLFAAFVAAAMVLAMRGLEPQSKS